MAHMPKITIEVDDAAIRGALADALQRIVDELRYGSYPYPIGGNFPPPPRVPPQGASDTVQIADSRIATPQPVTDDSTYSGDTLQFAPVEQAPAPVNAAAAPINVPAPAPQAPPAFEGFAAAVAPPVEAPAAEAPAAPKKRKPRRTKEQIEADRIREAQELLAKQQAAAAATPAAIPQPQAQIPQQPATEPQQVPQFPPLAIQTPQNPAPGAVAPTQPTPSDWTPSWAYASPEG